MVLGVQVLQVVDLIQKVACLIELQVGQWVGLGGFAFWVVQIGLGWVAVEKVGLG